MLEAESRPGRVAEADHRPGGVEGLLLELASQQATGALIIRDTEDDEATVWFRDGFVYAVSVPGRRPLLGVRLMSSGAITPEALAEALEVQRTELQGWRLGELLVHLGFVDRSVVESFVLEQQRDMMADLLTWTMLSHVFRNGRRTRTDLAPAVEVVDLLAEARDRRSRWSAIVEGIGGPEAVPLLAASSSGATDVVLGPHDWALLCKVDGQRTLSDLADDCGFTLFEAGQVLAGLLAAGLVDLEPVTDEELAVALHGHAAPAEDLDSRVATVTAALSDLFGDSGNGATALDPASFPDALDHALDEPGTVPAESGADTTDEADVAEDLADDEDDSPLAEVVDLAAHRQHEVPIDVPAPPAAAAAAPRADPPAASHPEAAPAMAGPARAESGQDEAGQDEAGQDEAVHDGAVRDGAVRDGAAHAEGDAVVEAVVGALATMPPDLFEIGAREPDAAELAAAEPTFEPADDTAALAPAGPDDGVHAADGQGDEAPSEDEPAGPPAAAAVEETVADGPTTLDSNPAAVAAAVSAPETLVAFVPAQVDEPPLADDPLVALTALAASPGGLPTPYPVYLLEETPSGAPELGSALPGDTTLSAYLTEAVAVGPRTTPAADAPAQAGVPDPAPDPAYDVRWEPMPSPVLPEAPLMAEPPAAVLPPPAVWPELPTAPPADAWADVLDAPAPEAWTQVLDAPPADAWTEAPDAPAPEAWTQVPPAPQPEAWIDALAEPVLPVPLLPDPAADVLLQRPDHETPFAAPTPFPPPVAPPAMAPLPEPVPVLAPLPTPRSEPPPEPFAVRHVAAEPDPVTAPVEATDTAAMLRELSLLTSMSADPSPKPPTARPAAARPADGKDAKKKKRGLFGR